MKLVAECLVVPLNRVPGANESPLKVALISLSKMCAHSPCRQFLRSSELLPVIGQLRQSPDKEIAKYATDIANKIANG